VDQGGAASSRGALTDQGRLRRGAGPVARHGQADSRNILFAHLRADDFIDMLYKDLKR
jgi:hypothetical protein